MNRTVVVAAVPAVAILAVFLVVALVSNSPSSSTNVNAHELFRRYQADKQGFRQTQVGKTFVVTGDVIQISADEPHISIGFWIACSPDETHGNEQILARFVPAKGSSGFPLVFLNQVQAMRQNRASNHVTIQGVLRIMDTGDRGGLVLNDAKLR